jgi:nucleoside-diphosphate-sugar epimerase
MLLAAGHEVTAIARSREQRAALERAGAAPRAVSLFARAELLDAMAGQDAVVNLATHIPHSTARMLMPGGWRDNDHIRREGAANLVDAALAAGVKRFVQESFAPIYVDGGDGWIDESAPVRPARYNRTVLDAEHAARRFTDGGGTGIVLRFGAFYGPDASQLAEMVRFVRRGWGPLPGPAESFMSSVAHDDAATAVVAALNAPAGTYNVVDDQPLRHRDFVDALADAVGAPHPRLPPPWMAGLAGSLGRTLARSHRISNRKLRQTCAWAPRYPSVREGFPAAVAGLPAPAGAAARRSSSRSQIR